jgi:hypothetical protein
VICGCRKLGYLDPQLSDLVRPLDAAGYFFKERTRPTVPAHMPAHEQVLLLLVILFYLFTRVLFTLTKIETAALTKKK